MVHTRKQRKINGGAQRKDSRTLCESLNAVRPAARSTFIEKFLTAFYPPARLPLRLTLSLSLITILVSSGCFLDSPVEPYYGRVIVPPAQVFRWSDGGLPQTFDPALAAAPPDTDAVRAMFEGLTDYDPQTLTPVPGVAASWKSSADGREWTFNLRHDARWSNGEPVTAHDFVRSWRRIVELGERAPHVRLMENIDGVGAALAHATPPPGVERPTPEASPKPSPTSEATDAERATNKAVNSDPDPKTFGAEALDDFTLQVRLQHPDLNFPALVAHPIFRPVHVEAKAANDSKENAQPVSNGAFRLLKTGSDGVLLGRAENYWDTRAVNLQRVQFVPMANSEAALSAYREGQIDAVTNAGVEPLGLKLLAPYKDFRRATFGALTYYSFNPAHKPFDDLRVRQALAYAIDRARISDDEMGGATEPAKKFLPVSAVNVKTPESADAPPLTYNRGLAQSLLREAGFENGKNFPRLRLLVNRNDLQRQVAQSVAAQWKSVLGIETEIVIKSWDEYEAALHVGDYDVARRGMVMQTTDEAINMRVMFAPDAQISEQAMPALNAVSETPSGGATSQSSETRIEFHNTGNANGNALPQVASEAQALKDLPAVPLYFASSYALVKPYVIGFDANLLDAPSLKRVRIDTAWQTPHPQPSQNIWFKSGD
jgi:ABC-type oligopeptide transport system substrate-binding subunit